MSEPSPRPYTFDAQRYAQFGILRQPNLDNLRNQEIAKLGEIPIVTANWGRRENAQEFIDRNRLAGIEMSDLDIAMINQSGFSAGWRNSSDIDATSEQYQEKHAQIGASLVKRVLRERRWDGVDLLVFGSISSKIDTPERISDILHRAGIKVDNTLFYGLACASATAPLGDINRIKSLENLRVVLIGMDTLSGSQFDPKDIQTSWTFGNGGGALAWKAGKEIEHIAGQAWVEKDEGMITVPEPYIYRLPDEKLPRESWPDWYNFVNEESKDAFAFFRGGVAMSMPSKAGIAVTKMSGKRTFIFFVKRVPTRLAEFFQTYDYHPLGTPIIHQPSKPVVDGIRNKYYELLAEYAQRKIVLPALDIGWVMEPTGVNNTSSATALFALAQKAKHKQIIPDVYTPLIGLGIGSMIHIDLLKFSGA